MFAAEFEPVKDGDRRRSRRAPVALDARVGRSGFDRTLCRVVNISMHGARLQTYSTIKSGGVIWLTLPVVGACTARVIWANEFDAGCEFIEALSQEQFDALVELSPATTETLAA